MKKLMIMAAAALGAMLVPAMALAGETGAVQTVSGEAHARAQPIAMESRKPVSTEATIGIRRGAPEATASKPLLAGKSTSGSGAADASAGGVDKPGVEPRTITQVIHLAAGTAVGAPNAQASPGKGAAIALTAMPKLGGGQKSDGGRGAADASAGSHSPVSPEHSAVARSAAAHGDSGRGAADASAGSHSRGDLSHAAMRTGSLRSDGGRGSADSSAGSRSAGGRMGLCRRGQGC